MDVFCKCKYLRTVLPCQTACNSWFSEEGSDVDSLDGVDPSIYGKVIPLPMVDQYTHWEVLWSNTNPEHKVAQEARMFAPILRDIKYRSRIIRLEFCHSFLNYYTELDAVELTGK